MESNIRLRRQAATDASNTAAAITAAGLKTEISGEGGT